VPRNRTRTSQSDASENRVRTMDVSVQPGLRARTHLGASREAPRCVTNDQPPAATAPICRSAAFAARWKWLSPNA
jgi:hypothetical protein